MNDFSNMIVIHHSDCARQLSKHHGHLNHALTLAVEVAENLVKLQPLQWFNHRLLSQVLDVSAEWA